MSEKRRPLLIVEDDPGLQSQMRLAFDQYGLPAGDPWPDYRKSVQDA